MIKYLENAELLDDDIIFSALANMLFDLTGIYVMANNNNNEFYRLDYKILY